MAEEQPILGDVESVTSTDYARFPAKKRIIIKNSSEPGRMPDPSSLVPGELAINLADQTIYTLSSDLQNVIPVGGGGGGDGASVFEIALANSDFAQAYYSIFDTANPDDIIYNGGVYNALSKCFEYQSRQYFVASTPGFGMNVYNLQILISSENLANLNIYYTTDVVADSSDIDSATWTQITAPYRITLSDPAYNGISIKVECAEKESASVGGFSVMYDMQGLQGTDTTAFDVYTTLSSDVAADTTIALPQNAVYNNNGKDLEVYRNGVKLVNGVQYSEVDSTHIKNLIDFKSGDTLEFRQYYGYVFVDDNHVANILTLQLSYRDVNSNYTAVNGDYIFADTSGGSFTVTLPASPVNGDTLYINDVKGTFDTNNLTVNPGGSQTIMGDTSLQLDVANKEYKFIYNVLNNDWRAV